MLKSPEKLKIEEERIVKGTEQSREFKDLKGNDRVEKSGDFQDLRRNDCEIY